VNVIRRAALATIAAGAAVVLHAQAPARDAGAAPEVPTGTATISGVVLDPDRQPLRRALVSIAGDMRVNRQTVTGDDGRFAFSKLPSGRFTVTASKPGYPPMSLGARRPFRPGSGVLVADGQSLTGLVLTLARGGVLTGTVFDDQGQPMPGVPIQAWELRTALSGERTFDEPSTGGEWVTTDDRGRYRVFGLPPGEYTVGTAWHYRGDGRDVHVPTEAEIRTAFLALTQPLRTAPGSTSSLPTAAASVQRFNYSPVFYPDTVDPLTAVTVALGAGDERSGLDIRMQFRPMSFVEGVVVGPDGPAASTRIGLQRRSSVQATNVTQSWGTDPDGRFRSTSLGPSEYTLLATTHADGSKPAMWAAADFAITGAEPVTLTLTLQPGMTMTGRVAFGNDTPLVDLSRVRVSLFSEGRLTGDTQSTVSASGELTISGITPGRYRIVASLPGATAADPSWTLLRVLADGQDVTDLPIDIAPGGAPLVAITLTDRPTQLAGHVEAPPGQSASDYFVVAMAADSRYWGSLSRRVSSTRPDAAGRYVFRNLPPGDYRLALTTDLVPLDLRDAAALSQLLPHSVPVTLAAGEQKTFDIKAGG
jgi:hypothetical protein